MDGYLWVKAFHILFVASWFAGLFYLPRIFVNLAMETEPAATARLLQMAKKLYKFMTLLAIPALLLGFALVGVYQIGVGGQSGWLHAKFSLFSPLPVTTTAAVAFCANLKQAKTHAVTHTSGGSMRCPWYS